MKNATRLSYRRRVMALSAVVSTMFAVLGLVSWVQLTQVRDQGDVVAEVTDAYIEASRMVDLADKLLEPAQDVVLFGDLQRVPSYTERYEEMRAELDSLGQATADTQTQAAVAQAKKRFAEANKHVEAGFELVLQGKSMEAGGAVAEASRVLSVALPELQQVHARAFNALNTQLATMGQTTSTTMVIVLGSCIVVIVFNTLLTGVLSRQILGAIGKNSRQIAASAQDLAHVGASIGNNADETFTQANAASAAAEEVSRHVQSVALAAEEMNSSVQEIAHSVHEVSRVANSAVSMADNTNQIMGKLADSSEEIGAVVKAITSIARQTNLLALNATIEAASAGEAGRGFAVVAKEVKDLAKETAKATEEIAERIGTIQTDTNAAIEAIEEIGDIINRISEIQSMVATAVEQQTVSTSEIQRRMADAAQGSSDIAVNITSVARTAETTTSGVSHSLEAANNVENLARDLQSMFA